MSEPRIVHRVSPLRRWPGPIVIFLICCLPMLDALGSDKGEATLAAGLFFLLFGLVLGAGMAWFIDRARVISDDQGLELRLPGCTTRTEWSNIARLDLSPGCQGAFLHASRGAGLRRVVRNLPGSLRQLPDKQATAFAEGKFLPLAPFMWQWEDKLGPIFQRNAPQLFTADCGHETEQD